MGLTNKKEDQLKNMPVIEARIVKSKDGKYIIHKTTITTIRPVLYYEKVLEDDVVEEESVVDSSKVEIEA